MKTVSPVTTQELKSCSLTPVKRRRTQ